MEASTSPFFPKLGSQHWQMNRWREGRRVLPAPSLCSMMGDNNLLLFIKVNASSGKLNCKDWLGFHNHRFWCDGGTSYHLRTPCQVFQEDDILFACKLVQIRSFSGSSVDSKVSLYGLLSLMHKIHSSVLFVPALSWVLANKVTALLFP